MIAIINDFNNHTISIINDLTETAILTFLLKPFNKF